MEGVRVTALQVLFDLLLIYGLDIIDASESSSASSPDNDAATDVSVMTDKTQEEKSGTASKLVAIICHFLDGEVGGW